MRSLALTPAQQRRIEKLAQRAGRTPQSMLRFVLRDGLEATEMDVRETLAADEDIDRNGAVPHAKVMAQAQATIERYAAKRRPKAA
jgi:predicted transcriptional regulator